jgi:hypothetical protein
MKKLIITLGLIVIVGSSLVFLLGLKNNPPKIDRPVACTVEAKICPDGSAVGRSGPKCEFAKCPDASTKSDVVLSVGQTGNAGGVQITLNEILEDSRCPAKVQCIWAGLVKAKVTIQVGTKSETVNIPTSVIPTLFEGHKISIISVTPEKQAGKTITASDYKVTFHVTQ